jgi:hypothetical protein
MFIALRRSARLSVGLKRLGEGLTNVESRFPLTRETLAKVKLKALRCGVWFRKLRKDERRFMELVIKVTDKVRSFKLTELVSRIVGKLLDAMGSVQAMTGKVAYKMNTDGLRIAQKLSQIAQGWGNRSATAWPRDSGFVQYLTIMWLNGSP